MEKRAHLTVALALWLLAFACHWAWAREEPSDVEIRLGTQPVLSVRWVGVGGRIQLLYVQPPRLTLWPTGRSLILPGSVVRQDELNPHQLIAKIEPGGHFAAVINRLEDTGVLVDLTQMRIVRPLRNVRDVGWREGRLCSVPADDGWHGIGSPAARWVVNGRLITGRRGFLVTAISEDARVLLARVMTGAGFVNAAVLRLSDDASKIVRITQLSPRDQPTYWDPETSGADYLTWNARRQAAAVVVGSDTGGGWSCAELYLISERLVRPNLQQLAGSNTSFVAGPPTWLGDRLVVSIRDQDPDIRIAGRWRKAERPFWIDDKLMLVDPFRRRAATLVETMIWPVVGAIDAAGERIAFAVRSPSGPTSSTITVERYSPSPARARPRNGEGRWRAPQRPSRRERAGSAASEDRRRTPARPHSRSVSRWIRWRNDLVPWRLASHASLLLQSDPRA
jgi:hypothetical protein